MAQLSLIVGILLIAGGLLIPGHLWISFFRPLPDSPLREQLMWGASIFRGSLMLLGAAVLIFRGLPFWHSARRPREDRPAPQSRTAIRIIASILAGAFALRLYRLNEGLWLDEVLTYVFYARMPFGEIVTTYHNENQHFIFTILAHACFLIFGEGAWALRFPAVLFGVASIWALYLFARQVTTTREALFAAALFAVSYHHVWFSQNARGYTGLLFWTLLSSWLFVRALREDRPVLWLAYAVTATLGIYTHITMLFVIAGQGLAYVRELWIRRNQTWPNRWSGLALGFCGAGLFTFQLHAMVLPQVFGGMQRTVSVVDAWKKPLWTMLEIFRGLQANFAGVAVAVIALLVFAAGLWSFARKSPLVLYLLFLPPLIGAGLVLAVGHHLWPRFFFFAFGFAAVVAIRGAMVFEGLLLNWIRKSVPAVGFLCTGMLLVSAASLPFAFGPKQDYLGAMAFVEAQRQPGDEVATTGLATFPYQQLYHANWKTVENVAQLNAVRAGAKRTFVLYTLEPVLQSMYPEVLANLKDNFRLLKRFPGTLQNGTVFVYIADGVSAEATQSTAVPRI
jgi:mannosyltransferase